MNFLTLASVSAPVALWECLPFGLLLFLIAVMPLSAPPIKHFWEKHYHQISIGLALAVGLYFSNSVPGGAGEVAHTAHEYVSFIALIGSLFVVAGGIHIKVRGESTPLQNVVFLLIGAVLANVIGTTGASMVLIRPWIRMNKIRISQYHIVFFIFVISNVGGSLTPIGDPPLFLGFLKGVPFFWLFEHVIQAWIVAVALILAVFFLYDNRSFSKMPRKLQIEVEKTDSWRFEGGLNVLLLAVILGAVFLPPHPFLREAVMLVAAAVSYFTTSKVVHEENAFSFGPIKEVAYLFAGIFATMIPALAYMEQQGPSWGFTHPLAYYFASGGLSSVLDNAPTYVNFLQLAESTARAQDAAAFGATTGVESIRILLTTHPLLVVAVSLGSVFFGAMTYIGNGPNFMVKSIADSSGVSTPTFFDYIVRFSVPVLFPILALTGYLFLR